MVVPEEAWVKDSLFYLGMAMGICGIVMGFMFRAGHLAKAARWYWDDDQPWYTRNLPFAWLPAGAFFLFASSGMAIVQSAPGAFRPLGWLLLTMGGMSSVAMFVFSYAPPRWLKPHWIREREDVGSHQRGAWSGGPFWRTVDAIGFAALLFAGLVFTAGVLLIALTT